MNILITGVGGPTPRSIALTLKNYASFRRYRLVGTDCDSLAIGLYQKHLFDRTYLIPAAPDAGYWRSIKKIVGANKIDFAFIEPETEVLEWAKRSGESALPCEALIPALPLARLLIDKSSMAEALMPHGLVPESIVIKSGADAFDKLKAALGLPFWIRKKTGSSGVGSLLVDSERALKGWMAINSGIATFLASRYLPGRNLTCMMLYFNGSLIRAACGERVKYIMSKTAPSGITGNTSFGRLTNTPEAFETARKAMDILFEKTGSARHGFFSVDLREDRKGRPLVTEINLRHIAFTSCFAAAGANFAEDTIRLYARDRSFDAGFKLYKFKKGISFLRDVDALPVVLKESDMPRRPTVFPFGPLL